MSATADIVTSQVDGLASRSQALTGSTVTVEGEDGSATTQRVQTGVVGDTTTQVVSGLRPATRSSTRSPRAAPARRPAADQLNSASAAAPAAAGSAAAGSAVAARRPAAAASAAAAAAADEP